MKHILSLISGLALSAILCGAAQAVTVTSFTSTFEEDSGNPTTFNFNGFVNWNVTSGAVDLIKNGAFGILCKPHPGTCVDTDGTTSQAGTLETKDTFAAGTYVVRFDISGNQRGGSSDILTLLFGGFSEPFTLNPFDPFVTIVRTITIGSESKLSFVAAGNDQFGIILDNVSVAPPAVPLPAALPLFATALAGVGLLEWRRRRIAAF